MSQHYSHLFACCKACAKTRRILSFSSRQIGQILQRYLYEIREDSQSQEADKKMSQDNQHSAQDKLNRDIVAKAMMHVPFDGWTDEMLALAAADCGVEAEEASRLIGGIDGTIALYAKMADEEMVAGFEALENRPERTHEKIRALILIRLEQAAPHKETVRKTLAYLAKPQQAPMASTLLYQTIDAMWRAAGDEATDFSFYSKRATLAAVYSATLMAFLGDDTPDMDKTKAFLDRRLKDVAQIPKLTKTPKAMLANAMQMASSFMGRRSF